jgi:SP family sugar:H+ symporter-like MFS transporter
MSNPSPSKHLQVIFISLAAAIGGFLFGFDSGVINGTVDALQAAFHSSSVGSGFNVASILLGCAVGAFLAGNLADRYGRRPVMLMAAILFDVSAWGSGISGGSTEFVIYRIMGGFAIGAASVICPTYISEIAPAHLRGRLASLQQLAIIFGLSASFFSNYLIVRVAGGAQAEFWWGFQAWQWMLWVNILPATLFAVVLMFIPESPRFLVAAGRLGQARAVLAKLSHPDDAERKVEEIRGTLATGHRPRMSDLIDRATGRFQPIVWVGIGLACLQQLVGINVVFYYGATLWQAAGFTESDALAINLISGTVNIVATFVAIALIDRVGRKPLLFWGSVGMVISLGLLSVIFGRAAVDASGRLAMSAGEGRTALVAANIYVFFFCVSWGPVLWVMLSEMFENQIRGAALAVSGFALWITNFIVTMTFPVLLTKAGLGVAYGIYCGFALISIYFMLKFTKETKGLTLEEM